MVRTPLKGRDHLLVANGTAEQLHKQVSLLHKRHVPGMHGDSTIVQTRRPSSCLEGEPVVSLVYARGNAD